MARWQFCLGLLLVTSATAYYNGHQVWSVERGVTNARVLEMELQGLVDVLGYTNSTLTVRVPPQSASQLREELQEAGALYKVLVEDLEAFIKEEKEEGERLRSLHRAESCTSSSCPTPLVFSYMSFREMEWYLKELAKNPRVELTSIGKSILERDIWMVHIKAGKFGGCQQSVFPVRCPKKDSNQRKTKAVWLEGGIHAREWISPAVTLQLIDQLVRDCCVTRWLDVYVVPMANPDGYDYSFHHERLWRKNRRDNVGSSCDGVDLNRNWDFHYSVGASNDPCSTVYMGTEPFSEPETRALRNAMQKLDTKGNLEMVIALHSYGQLMMYPWGWTTDPAPHKDDMVSMGNVFSQKARVGYGTVYKVVNTGGGLYFAAGATDDWAKGVLKTKYVYTLELRDRGNEGFKLSPIYIKPSGKEVWAGLKAILRKLSLEK